MLEFPIEFFDDEVRDGFYVPSIMKHCWAGQMEVINTVDDICKKNNIKYYLFSGTLLGAIRHGGYIPWDDDVDICMLRKDYQKFIKVAKSYAPEKYYIRNMHTDSTYRDCFTRFSNSAELEFNEEFWEYGHGFISTAGIDVFPLDYIPSDIEYRDKIRDEARWFYSIAMNYDKEGMSDNVRRMIEGAEDTYGIHIDVSDPDKIPQQALINMENTFRKVRSCDGRKVHIPMVWLDHVDSGIPARAFDESVDVIFENTTFKAPYLYDDVLKMYGDYMKSVRVCDIHNYPWYVTILKEVQKIKYENYYDYDEKVLPRPNRHEEWQNKRIDELNETVELFTKASSVAEQAFNSGDAENGNLLMEKCQALATQAEKIEKSIKGNGRERVIFFTWKAEYWNSFDPFYREEIAAGNEVYVIPVPFVRMTEARKMSDRFIELEGFPDDVILTDYESFDYEEYRIDRIYVQNNYDDMNGACRITDFFHTTNLQNYTDELIYIPWFTLDEYGEDDERAAYVSKYFILMPGTVACDRMIITQEWFKDACIRELVKWAGEDTRQIWEDKIEVVSIIDDAPAVDVTKDKKRLFYYIGTGQLLSNPEQMLEKLENNFNIFEASADKIEVHFFVEKGLVESVAKYRTKLSRKLNAILEKYEAANWCAYTKADKQLDVNDRYIYNLVDDSDAFYGDAGVIMHMFSRAKKPVMMQNIMV